MFYRKNTYRRKQIVRLAAGVALAIYDNTAMAKTSIAYALIAAGLFTDLSGIFGFCTTCAIVGRKLPQAPQ